MADLLVTFRDSKNRIVRFLKKVFPGTRPSARPDSLSVRGLRSSASGKGPGPQTADPVPADGTGSSSGGGTRHFSPLRSISSKVIISFALIVLLQGFMSILFMRWISERATATTLEDQSRRTVVLIERFFDDAYRDSLVKVRLLSGQKAIADGIKDQAAGRLRHELELFRGPLALDAIFVIGADGEPVASSGDPLMLRMGMKAGIGKSLLSGALPYTGDGELDAMAGYRTTRKDPLLAPAEVRGTVVLSGQGNKIHLWAVHPVVSGDRIAGVLCAAIGLDRWFIGRIEGISNTAMLLALRDSILVNGRLSDETFIAYSRITSARPADANSGYIRDFEYRAVRFSSFPELKLVFFLDRKPTRELMDRYVGITLLLMAVTLVLAFGLAVILYRFSFWKPFREFQDAIRTISRGDLSYSPSRQHAAEEFAELEDEFEHMTHNLRKVEERLRLTSRMAAVGEMVAGVAHQIRNPLAVMKVSSEMIRDGLDEGKDPGGTLRRLARMLGTEIDSLEETVTKFLDFTRPLQVHRELVFIRELFAQALSRVPRARLVGVEIRITLDPEDLAARIDRHLLDQALTNLVLNALQALGGKGCLSLHACGQDGSLSLSVSDTGPGMSPEVRSRVFDPFFTTKSDGTGLGLSVVHRITEAHAGQATLESDPDHGTTVTMVFPDCVPDSCSARDAASSGSGNGVLSGAGKNPEAS